MEEIKKFDLRKNTEEEYSIERYAIRGVVFSHNKILLLKLTETEEYKFPGGGVESGEDFQQTLIRETLEETGYEVTEIGECFGYIDQIYPDKYVQGEIFSLRSIYYSIKVSENSTEPNLSKQEKELGFMPVWVTLDEAIKLNKIRLDKGSTHHWTIRELYMLEYLKKKKGF